MKTLTHVDAFSSAKVFALLYLAIGLIFGVLYGLFLIIAGLFGGEGYLVALAILAIIGFPLFYAVLGFIMGLLAAAIYNFIAKRFGGLELEIK